MVDVSKLRETSAKPQMHKSLGQNCKHWEFDNSKRYTATLNDLSKQSPRLLEVARNALKTILPGILVSLSNCFVIAFSVN